MTTNSIWRLLVLLPGMAFAMPGAEPANTNANPQARAILNYFEALGNRSEKRVLSGQFTDFGRGANVGLLSEIHEKTGYWPALMGADYADFRTGGLHWQVPNQTAIDYWRRGGLVSISAHLYNPAREGGGGLRDKGVAIEELLAPDTPTRARWIRELDELATGLQELKEAGVVVLWRPFHEMNGDWFWWGAQEPAAFIKVWRHMFDYFSTTKRLDHLLWVYGPNHGSKTAAYYPGDRYVDLVGLDAYTDFIDKAHIRGADEVVALGKPFGFSEFGPYGSRNPPGDYDYRRFIGGVVTNFPQTVYFMSWNAKWSLARNQHVREMLEHPWIANREDLPADLIPKVPTATLVPAKDSNTAVGWQKYVGNPVLGGALGTCFDVSLLREVSRYRMWYSGGEQYEPDAIGHATSPDGLHWTKSAANPVFRADPARQWERHKVTACQVVPQDGWFYMFHIGFRDVDHAQIGLAFHEGQDLGF